MELFKVTWLLVALNLFLAMCPPKLILSKGERLTDASRRHKRGIFTIFSLQSTFCRSIQGWENLTPMDVCPTYFSRFHSPTNKHTWEVTYPSRKSILNKYATLYLKQCLKLVLPIRIRAIIASNPINFFFFQI